MEKENDVRLRASMRASLRLAVVPASLLLVACPDVFNRVRPFLFATNSHAVPWPASADVLPEQPFGPEFTDYSCTDADTGIALPLEAGAARVTVRGVEADWLCLIGPEWNGGADNVAPPPRRPTIVANGEDDYELAFDPPVHALGLDLLTNGLADEKVTLRYQDGTEQLFSTDLRTAPNEFAFVGFKSLAPITSALVDTAGGIEQNEGIEGIWTSAFFKVAIDVKPGSFPNSVNCKSKGKIPVAILGEPGFWPLRDLDVSTLTFGATGFEHSLAFCNEGGERVNRDRIPDLVCHFETQEADFCAYPDVTHAILRGQTHDGTPLVAADAIRIVPGSFRPGEGLRCDHPRGHHWTCGCSGHDDHHEDDDDEAGWDDDGWDGDIQHDRDTDD